MPITGIVGDLGGGKTLLMTYQGYKRFLRGQRIMANYGVRYKHARLNAAVLVEMDADLQDLVILGDEFHIVIDSRNSMTADNKAITYFVLQTRKRNVHLYFTTQDEGQVDVRLRMRVDYWIYCTRIGKHHFRYKIYTRRGKLIGTLVLDGRKYYHLYDTTETITDFRKPAETKPERRSRPQVVL